MKNLLQKIMKLFAVISVIGGVHRQCNNLYKKTYRDLQKTDMPWYCKTCIKDITHFWNLTDIELEKLINRKTLIPKKLNENHESFFDQVHYLAENDDVIDCKYYDINRFKGLKLHEINEKFSLLHMNIWSLPYYFDNFQQLLLNLKIDFDIIDIAESRIKSKKAPASSIDLIKYNTEHTPTDAEKGGALLYISKQLNYKRRTDLQIAKSKQIESAAIEIIDKTHKNTIVICIYKHPNLSIADFNEGYLQHLLDKLSYERKNIIVLGDFNIDLLHYETDYQTRNFLDRMYSNSLAPKITIPTKAHHSFKNPNW